MDVRNFSEGGGAFTLVISGALIQLMAGLGDIDQAFEQDRQSRIGLVPGVVLTVQNATQIVLRPVADVATEVTR